MLSVATIRPHPVEAAKGGLRGVLREGLLITFHNLVQEIFGISLLTSLFLSGWFVGFLFWLKVFLKHVTKTSALTALALPLEWGQSSSQNRSGGFSSVAVVIS